MKKCKQTRKHKYTFTILISSWRCQSSRTRQQSCRWTSSAKNTEKLLSGASGQKPQLTKSGKRILWNTEHFVPIVVPGLATAFSSSNASSSSTSLPQDTYDDTSSSPALQRTFRHREIDRAICQSGLWSSQKFSKTKKSEHEGRHPQTLLTVQIRNVLQKWTEIAKSARKPRLQGLLAESALVKQHFSRRKVWWPDNSKSQSSQWGRWISRQSPIRNRYKI